ncbi:MAG: hypothetical protein DHS20C07_31340 [Methyloligella sp.]|nr:MAG: hypothetical protein DHS20C07_31340 [Methyloligella sp.]
MAGSVFESVEKKSRKKKISITIPTDLDKLITDIIADLKVKAPSLQFNTTAICVDALYKAVRKAKSELEQMEKPQQKSEPETKFQSKIESDTQAQIETPPEDIVT